MTNIEKQISIQINALKRIKKDINMYEEEVNNQTNKVNFMKENNEDKYDIKKQEEILEESHMMIPNSKKRLQTFIEKLHSLLDENENIPDELRDEALDIINLVNVYFC